jgi:hypothetical protein
MKYLKKYDMFLEEVEATLSKPAPTKPTTTPGIKPGKPGQAPSRPSPVRRDKPSVDPAPKAKKATAEEVAEKFISLANARNIDFKKELGE